MYKIEIKLSDSDWSDDVLTIESNDFEKIQIIQEFIDFQKEYGWAVDYEAVTEFYVDENYEDESAEDAESEEFEIGETVQDEDGLVWQRIA